DASGNLAWRPSSVECGIKYVSLAAGPSGRLYSVGKGRGLFEISGIGTDAYLADHLYPYNATGLLLLADDGSRIFVAAGENNGVETDDFTQIFNHNLASSSPTRTYRFAGNDFGNDLLFHRGNNTLYATGTDASGQRVLGFVNAEDGDQFSAIPLEDSEYIRLELSMARETGEFLMLTLSDKLKVVRVYIPNHDLDREFRIPAQVFPLDIAFDNKAGRGYILNAPVNTLTEIDLARAYHTDPAPNFTHEPPYELAEYRYEVMAAYQSLFRHFIQYLKDCFCEKFLIDCPDCGPDDKVYLGCVEIRDGEVFNICNFTRRKYVKTFRTVEYWLSAFPVLPVFKKAFAQFCCLILDPKTGRDDFFTNKNL
ncbi:MAG: hypothetical protein H6558_21790, partial [Lewinellaceae bacterium]|nr:hypothetical protein [Lewinellaceae bacterium]